MPKYALTNGQKANFLKGRKKTKINGVNVEIVEDILFEEGSIVDTGDFSLQSFVDIGMVEEVFDRVETEKTEDAVSVMTDIEEVQPSSVFVGVVDVQEDKTVETEVANSDVREEVIDVIETVGVVQGVEAEVVSEPNVVEVPVDTKKRGRPGKGAAK